MSCHVVHIDGSVLEGGGQIIRMALTLSSLCSTPIRVTNIRNGRSKPGLMAQHLKGLELLSEISRAKVKGNQFGSTEIEFWPREINGGVYSADAQTAGSISLFLQVALPCLLFANSETTLRLRGGTNAEMAPQIDFTTEVFKPIMEKFGATFDFDLIKRGYFPKGGGEVSINVCPIRELTPVTMLEQGKIRKIHGWSFVAGVLPIHVANAMANSATQVLKKVYPFVEVDIFRYKEDPKVADGNCSETTTGCILGSSALGKRNVPAEQSGKESAEELLNTLKTGACIDRWSQDQIIILMVLASGKSQVRIGKMTLHTQTAIFIAEKLTQAKFEVVNDGTSSIISCEGIGIKNVH